MADTCSIAGFDSIMENTVLPLSLVASFTTMMVVALSYMLSQAISNPKLSLWAKTEAVQLLISVGTVFLLITLMNTFCTIQVSEMASLFGLSAGPLSIYEGAQTYLADAGHFSIQALTVCRYHLEAYNVMSALNAFECEFGGGIGCLFGYSGTNVQPMGGYGAHQAAMNIFFNSTIMSVVSALNFLFILQFVYKGFVLLFLPLGIFMRAVPYMRTFGGLLISLTLSFLIVYPFLLSVFYMMESLLLEPPADMSHFLDESVFDEESGAGQSVEAAAGGNDAVWNNYFPGDMPDGDNPTGAIAFAAYAFIAAVFLPTVALLGTIGSIVYITRLYGEEIDLSRIVQMV
jgi:hypothetical protein